ncbi:type VI secretion system protein TssL, long form [Cupriavidus basilensis]|uniref:type VI secretion system protein TssL, long form n=1 Tax=Cupriavidus basilensis TaxID=68895 RepID=UPI0020C7119E|nr:type VI secretion system protein TssL, long form [Cupriavidus basilensis]
MNNPDASTGSGTRPYRDASGAGIADARFAPETVAELAGARSPLLEAARPLLRALADVPEGLDEEDVPRLQALLTREVKRFHGLCERANVRREHILAASYALCTALDEAAHNQAWGIHSWPQQGLLVSLHGDTEGGTKCFHLLGRLVSSPHEHMPVIEVFYHVLSLGFEGRYAGQTDGHRQLDEIRQRLFHLISGARESVPRELSPNWRGAAAGRLSRLRTVPVWVTVVVLALALFGLFAWFKYQLLLRTHDLEQQILAIGKITPPEPPKALRLAELLKDEIARGVVSVQEDATRSAVTFRGDDMFGGGRAEVSGKILPLLDKVAGEISKVSGKVTVIGHSDNAPIKTARFPSNQALSEERAATVTEYLASKGVAKGRLEAIGKGDTEPLIDNKTPAARAKNRRVEIVVTQ